MPEKTQSSQPLHGGYLAYGISAVLHPAWALAIWIVQSAVPWALRGWTLLACVGLPLLLTLTLALRWGDRSLELQQRQQRVLPLLGVLAGLLLCVAALVLWPQKGGPELGHRLTMPLLVVAAAWLLNLRIKLSLHILGWVPGLWGFVLHCTHCPTPTTAGACALIVPVLLWARRARHAHTWPELALGAAVGLALSGVWFRWLAGA